MAGKKRTPLKSAFNLGGEAAEADRLLEEAFYESSDYQVIESRSDPRCFIVGRTGAGKSAALRHLEDVHQEHVIRINPINLSLPYITNLQAIRYLDSLEVNLDNFWNVLWRHVLLVEIIRHRYKVDSPEAKNNFLIGLRDKVKGDRTKQAALEYLDEFEGKFWCDTDERVREITDKLTERLSAGAGMDTGVPGVKLSVKGETSLESSSESRAQQVDRFQRIVNESQLARLTKMVDVLDDHILASPHDFRYVVIDDLDLEWVDERIANDLIRCLFTTVYSLQHVTNLKVLVALRTNIFQELEFGRRGGGQEEKLRALVLNVRWTRRDLELLLDERVRVAAEEASIPVSTINGLLPHANSTMGKPLDYILDRTLLRPRDALAFVNECLRTGLGKQKLPWVDIKTAERAYSTGRLQALRDEWKGTYPGFDRVIDVFRRCPARMSKKDFSQRLDEIMLLPANRAFEGVKWITDASTSFMTAGPNASWAESYQPIVSILYRVGLVGISLGSGAPRFYIDDPVLVEHQSDLDKAEHFFIHRMFHQGLDIQTEKR
jgi:hypothetical protein